MDTILSSSRYMDLAILLSELAPLLAISDQLLAVSELIAGSSQLIANWLPRRHRAGPSASLDKSEYEVISGGLYHKRFSLASRIGMYPKEWGKLSSPQSARAFEFFLRELGDLCGWLL